MIDNIIFYSMFDNKIYFLFGKKLSTQKYETFKYDYFNPFDDSSIVPLFEKDFGNYLIPPDKLLLIIKKTYYPHFMKLNKNGLIYMIKIDYINEIDINYHQSKKQSNKWSKLKWIDINDNGTMRDQVNIADRILITNSNSIKFIKNQYNINYLLYSSKDFQIITNIMKKKKNKTIDNDIKNNHQIQHEQNLKKHFKKYQYHQMASLYTYTTYCTYMNELLRCLLASKNNCNHNNKSLITLNNKEHLQNAINILAIINQAPKYSIFNTHYLSLYRGISFDPCLVINQVTDVFKFSFVSTSSNIHIASNGFVPTGGALFKLIIPADTPMVATKLVSHHPYEDEILLPPGCSFRNIKKDTYYNTDLNTNQIYYTIVLHQLFDYSNVLFTTIQNYKIK